MIRLVWHVFGFATFLGVLGATLFGWYWLAERGGWFDPKAPPAWRANASPAAVLSVPDYRVAYWGKPDARYSVYATRRREKPVAIVVHFTYFPHSLYGLVRYGHRRDFGRGGGSFGYHVYIGWTGKIVQGAPLTKRTNHIKSQRRPQRTDVGKHLWSGNTIGISLIGACNPVRAPRWGNMRRCSRETPTNAQLEAGLAVIRALQRRFGMACGEVYGHGDLQTDRDSFEGATLTRLARLACAGKRGGPTAANKRTGTAVRLTQ